MIISLPCIGIAYGKSKNGKPFTKVWLDVTSCVPETDRIGVYSSVAFYDGVLSKSVIGTDVICSVDKFLRVSDVDIIT
jgi:hypothetical protein